jgi:hypothetical protein
MRRCALQAPQAVVGWYRMTGRTGRLGNISQSHGQGGHVDFFRIRRNQKDAHNSQIGNGRQIRLEVVSKPPLGPDPGVGARRLILKILHVFLRLIASPRLDLEPD